MTKAAPPARGGGCLKVVAGSVIAIVVILVIGFWWLSSSLTVSDMPALVRPMDVAEGSVALADGFPASVEVSASISAAAVAAAAAQDGTVYFELDLTVPDAGEPIEVEVARRDAPHMVRPAEALPPGADVRWTLTCAPDKPCSARFELIFGQAAGDDVSIGWRLTAEVRPHRSTEVDSGATIELRVEES